MTTHYNLIIIGAGLSGIGTACHYMRDCGDDDFAILEARATMGGTWDLFRYPGIRSDSDMHTLGYNFKPWTNAKAIADGPSILISAVPSFTRSTGRKTLTMRAKKLLSSALARRR